MRIVFNNFAVDWGGGERWTLRTAAGLAERGHSILLVGRTGTPLPVEARKSGLETVDLKPGPDYHLPMIFYLRTLLKRFGADVLVAHHNRDIRTAGVAASSAAIPVVHRNGFPVLKNRLRHRFSHRFTRRILTNSERIRDTYLGFGWIDPDTIDVVPNGIEPISPTADPAGIRRNWGVEQNSLVALYAGRLTGVKRVEDLLDAFAGLDPESRWTLVVMGEGRQAVSLRQKAERLQLADRVHFTGFSDKAAHQFTAADLVVLPSSEEGMPNTLMEAMVQGIPVAATPVGDVPYLLDHGRAGSLVPVGDTGAWIRLLQSLEADPSVLSDMGNRARERIRSRFTLESMLDGVERSFNKALHGTQR
ncbi:glycosyltransferase [bacterium]|nr:glycosyltransferase [bacterium]